MGRMETALLLTIRAGAFLVLVIPLIVNADPLPNTFFPFIVGKALYGRALIEALTGLWVVLALRFPAYRPPRSWLLIIFGVYLVVGILASVLGVSPIRSLWSTYERMQGMVDLAHWFALTVVLVSVFRSNVDWRALLNVNLGVGLVVAVLGVFQNFDAARWIFPFLLARDRIDITLGNPTYVGAYMLVSFIIGLGFLVSSFRAGTAEAQDEDPSDTRAGPKERRRRRRRSQPRRLRGSSLPTWILFGAFWIGVAALAIWTPPTRWGGGGAAVVLLIVAAAAGTVAYSLWKIEEPDRPRMYALGPPLFWWRWFWMLAIALSFWMLIWSGTRGAFIGLVAAVVGFAIVYLFIGRIRWIRVAAVSLLGVLAVLALLVGVARNTSFIQNLGDVNPLIGQIVNTGAADDNSPRSRLASLKAGLRGFADRPILGWGPENYSIAYDRHVGAESFIGVADSYDQAHNKLLEELTTKGILGLLAYLALWLVMMRVIIRRARSEPDREQAFLLFIGAALLGYFVQNLFLFDTPGTIVQFVLLLGFAAHLETTQPGSVSVMDEGPTRDRLKEMEPAGQGVMWLTSLMALVLVGFGIFTIAWQPYRATQTVLQTLRSGISWNQRMVLFERSIEGFPPLANYPRIIMFNLLASNWENIPDESVVKDLKGDDSFVKVVAEDALAAEPEEWRIYLALAGLYQSAAPDDQTLLEVSRGYIETAQGLAPERPEVYEAWARQLIGERDYKAARDAIDGYLLLNPRAAFRFDGFLTQIDAAEASEGAEQPEVPDEDAAAQPE